VGEKLVLLPHSFGAQLGRLGASRASRLNRHLGTKPFDWQSMHIWPSGSASSGSVG